MKKLTIFFLIFVACILSHSGLSLSYASAGLTLWFQKMIPALLPFMILSGIMVRLNLTEKIAMLIFPLVHPLYRISKNACYAMLMGFLCGFPMGARVVADLYERNRLSRREAEYLLAFCNNIGPVYFCSFALPLLNLQGILPFLFGMYGIPLLYGLFLRHTCYKDILPHNVSAGNQNRHLCKAEMMCCQHTASQITSTGKTSAKKHLFPTGHTPCEKKTGEIILAELDHSIHAALQNILMLGGYMVIFNLLNLLPHLIWGESNALVAPLLEISGGLALLKDSLPLYSLVVLSFGGLSCLAQTYSCISKTDLSIGNYIRHKCILTALSTVYYLCLFCFLRLT